MITIGDLRAREVLPSWQEAVAIVQELIDVTGAATTTAAALPDVQHIGLGPEGSIVVLPGPSASASSNGVHRLAVMLDLLLDGVPAPDQLKALVSRNVMERPESQTVEDFAHALSFFERPGRRADIQALAERASAASERTRADEELRRLQAKALEAERSAAPEQKEDPRRQRRIPSLAVFAALTAGVLLIGVGAALYYRATAARAEQQTRSDEIPGKRESLKKPDDSSPRTASAPAGTAPPAAPTGPVSLLSRLTNAVRTAASSFGRSAPSEAVPEPPSAKPKVSAERRRSRKPAATATGSGEDAASATTDQPVVIITELGGYPLEPTTPDLIVDNTVGIYSRSDTEVKAPVMVRPVLPTAPPADVPPDQLGTLELLVDERGNVEHVRLFSPFNRHQERMIVSNAKAWKFKPATRGGRPVKYQSRIRLTI